MGNRNSGPKPQPTAVKLLRGIPGKRRLPANEPKMERAPVSFDEPPKELDGDLMAIAEWRRTAPILRMCGIATESERFALMSLCQQWSRYLEAHWKIRTLGLVVKKSNGEPMLNPYLKIETAAFDKCLKLWAELGLTPSARTRLAAIPANDFPKEGLNKWDGLIA